MGPERKKNTSFSDLIAAACIGAMVESSREFTERRRKELDVVSAETESLVQEIEQHHFMLAIDKSLANHDEDMFIRLVRQVREGDDID